MNFDAVTTGSIVSVVLAIIILIFLGFKVNKLMARDAEKHRHEPD